MFGFNEECIRSFDADMHLLLLRLLRIRLIEQSVYSAPFKLPDAYVTLFGMRQRCAYNVPIARRCKSTKAVAHPCHPHIRQIAI